MPIWDSEAFASVRSLTLLDAGAGQLVHDPSLLEGLLELPLVDRLERLDLRGIPMSAALLDAIAKARAKLPRELWLSDPTDERRS